MRTRRRSPGNEAEMALNRFFAEMRNKTRMLHAEIMSEAKDHCRLFKDKPVGDFVQFWLFSAKYLPAFLV